MVFVTFVLAWIAIFYSIYSHESSIAVSALTLVGGVAAVYMGVGHADLRAILTNIGTTNAYFPPMGPTELAGGGN